MYDNRHRESQDHPGFSLKKGPVLLQKIKALHPGDKTVALLLGKQTAPENPAELLRPSQFVFYVFAGDGYALFHTLTKKTVLVSPALIRFFLGGGYTWEELRAQGAEELFEDCFIVRDSADEYRDYSYRVFKLGYSIRLRRNS